MTETIDVVVENQGALFLFHPLTEAADEWIEQNVQEAAQWWTGALVMEHGYAHDLAEGMIADGLILQ